MLGINLKGKRAFVTGVGDDQGYGWAIAKALAEAGAELIFGVWTPMLKIFNQSWEMGKFDTSRQLSNGSLMQPLKIYPLDASFDKPEEIPEEIKANKRYQIEGYTISEVAERIKKDFGQISILVHSLANGPEVKNPILETSRKGYLAAISNSSYSLVSLVQQFGPLIESKGAILSLTYIASERVIPGYGGGMSSAKAALESDTRTLAWEAGRKWNIRINSISAGPFRSRAAKAIGFIDQMVTYSHNNAPLKKELFAEEVGNTAAFLLSDLASAITGTTLYVDNGLHVMGIAIDSPSIQSIK